MFVHLQRFRTGNRGWCPGEREESEYKQVIAAAVDSLSGDAPPFSCLPLYSAYYQTAMTMIPLNRMCERYRVKVTSKKWPKGRLLGLRGFLPLVGEELAIKLLARAERGKTDKITYRLRRGLRFDFYVK